MLFDPKFIAQKLGLDWEGILKWFPDLRMAIIVRYPGEPPKLVVERASQKQLANFPDLEGKVCYEYVNGFSCPCEWCPVMQTIEDRQIHVQVARSPMPKGGSSEPDVGEMVYAILVAVPLWPGEDGADRVLEISFDRTKHEKDIYERRTRKYDFEANLCRSIEMVADKNTVNEFILFGAVAEAGIGCQTAHLFLTDSDNPNNLDAPVSQRLTLTQDGRTHPVLKVIANAFQAGSAPVDWATLRGKLFPLIKRYSYNSPRTLAEVLLEYEVLEPQRLEEHLSIPAGVRVRSRCAVFPVLGLHRKLHGVLMAQCHQDTLISDEDLVDLGIFALFVSYALASRDLTLACDNALKRLEEFTQQFGNVPEDLIYTGAVVTGLGHDLRSSHREMRGLINTLIAEIPKSKQKSAPVKPVIEQLLKFLEFQKKCLDRIMNTAMVARPLFHKHDFAKIVAGVKDSFEHTLNEAGVDIVIRSHLSPQGKIVECDEFLIRQVLINLIDNSLYWISQARKKKIEIELYNIDEQHVEIKYKDTGPGIAQEIRNKIWEPFFTMKPGRGMGLGLTTTKRIVEKAHHGKIQLYSDAGWGTCFLIQLPLKQ
ncbi:HAMP domain-containing histidine kinase [Candidatus Poribacteria bacterium]|nr:HAMP domain-containing histidine kinase [Candidatus Poribacteria bacterium]